MFQLECLGLDEMYIFCFKYHFLYDDSLSKRMINAGLSRCYNLKQTLRFQNCTILRFTHENSVHIPCFPKPATCLAHHSLLDITTVKIYNWNSMEQSRSPEADSHSASQEIPRFLWAQKFHYSLHQKPATGPYPEPAESIWSHRYLSP